MTMKVYGRRVATGLGMLLAAAVLLGANHQGYYQARCVTEHLEWRGACHAHPNDNIAWAAAARERDQHDRERHDGNRSGWINRGCSD